MNLASSRKKLLCGLVVSICIAGFKPELDAREATPKLIAGYVENTIVFPGKLKIHAKLDTGAENSSLNAQDIEHFRRGEADWVRFSVTNDEGETVSFERPVIRTAKIKRHAAKKQERPVISLGICLDSIYKDVEVNLIDRSGFSYQMLIGRSFLEGDFLIDPEHRFMLQSSCEVKR